MEKDGEGREGGKRREKEEGGGRRRKEKLSESICATL